MSLACCESDNMSYNLSLKQKVVMKFRTFCLLSSWTQMHDIQDLLIVTIDIVTFSLYSKFELYYTKLLFQIYEIFAEGEIDFIIRDFQCTFQQKTRITRGKLDSSSRLLNWQFYSLFKCEGCWLERFTTLFLLTWM